MKPSHHNLKHNRRVPARLGAAVVVLFCFGLLFAAAAIASYERVGYFAGTPGALFEASLKSWPEEVQLGGVGGVAVNYTGAGGVPAGTIYAADTDPDGGMRVTRYNPNYSFSEAWSFAGSPPNIRCGPEGEPSHPVCRSEGSGGPRDIDVDVDQTTGDVYVLAESNDAGPETGLIHVYTPDGSRVLAEFGEQGAYGETITEGPEKLHDSSFPGGLAVNSVGDVYVFDYTNSIESFRHRVMEFEPESSGDYEHYVYAGQAHDLADGNAANPDPTHPVTDAAGNVYVADERSIAEYDPSHPTAPPLCEFKLPAGSIGPVTVNPETGEVFFYVSHDKKIHELLPCDAAEGKFTEAGTTAPLSPARTNVSGLAFDPVRRFGPGRPLGVLYAVASDGEGGKVEKGLSESSLGYIFAEAAELSPVVESESVTHVTTSSAVLGAQVDPEGSATRYAFQYISQAGYESNEPGEPFAGSTEVPLGGAVVGEGTEAVAVSASLAGLEPDTSYRYRVLASSNCSVSEPAKVCEATGETRSLHTFAVQTTDVLPDGRVYELVSPPQKSGGQVLPADPSIGSCGLDCKPGSVGGRYTVASAPDGDSVVYRGTPFSPEGGSVGVNEYIARRNATSGWQSTDLNPASVDGREGGTGYIAFSGDLSRGLLGETHIALNGEAPEGYANLYSQPSEDPSSLTALLSIVPPHRSGSGSQNETFKISYAGASADMSRVFFEANDALTEEVPGIAPVAVDGGAGKSNLYEWTEGRLSLVNVMPGNETTQPGASFGTSDAHAISDDGRHLFFSDGSGQVFMREDGQSTTEITTEGVADPGHFLAAAADGSAVLLADGHLHYLGGEESTVDLTDGHGGFQGLVGQSEDLSHLYFIDTAALTGEEENEDCKAVSGKQTCEEAREGADNLYAWTQAAGTHFVATLAVADNSDNGVAPLNDWTPVPSVRTAQASPHGRFLAFLSDAPLTGYDSTGPCISNGASSLCPEVFLYDSGTDKLVCPSCNPSGGRPLGWSVLRRILGASDLPLPHYLTDEGRLFFDSRDSLVPADTNGGVEDVYEYEPLGLGTCERAGGCVSLISSGTGLNDSNFLAADENGENIFFTTLDQLTRRDGDGAFDLYDARVQGGIPGETGALTSECQGEACQPSAGAAPFLAPTSLSFEGAGNAKEFKSSASSKTLARKKPKHKKSKPKKSKQKKSKGKKRKKSHATKRSVKRTVKHNHGDAK